MPHPNERGGICIKKRVPNDPPHPPMPASRHREKVLHIPVDYQLPEHPAFVEN